MTAQYELLPAAERDLDDQAAYLAQEAGIDTALRFYDSAAATFTWIARRPGIGEPRGVADAQLEGLRVWRMEGFPQHLIYYRATDEGIVVVRVLHRRRSSSASSSFGFCTEHATPTASSVESRG